MIFFLLSLSYPRFFFFSLYIQVVLHHAGRAIACAATAPLSISVEELRRNGGRTRRMEWSDRVSNHSMLICNAPRALRMCLIVGVSVDGRKDAGIAWINHPLFDPEGACVYGHKIAVELAQIQSVKNVP